MLAAQDVSAHAPDQRPVPVDEGHEDFFFTQRGETLEELRVAQLPNVP